MSDLGRGWGECGNPECFDEEGWPPVTKKKGRDRVCTQCGWTQEGYRSPPECGWERVKINRKAVEAISPRLVPQGIAMIFSYPVGYLSPDDKHLKVIKLPNLLGKILMLAIGVPVALAMRGAVETFPAIYPEIIAPLKCGKVSSEDIFIREFKDDEESFRELYRRRK